MVRSDWWVSPAGCSNAAMHRPKGATSGVLALINRATWHEKRATDVAPFVNREPLNRGDRSDRRLPARYE